MLSRLLATRFALQHSEIPRLRSITALSTFIVAFTSLIAILQGRVEGQDQYPRKPIKVIVPFGAGGGSDTFTRIMQKAIQDQKLLPEPLVIINVPGAGGSVGSRRVKNARPDGYTILQIHEGMLTNQYSGNANFGASSFEPIAGTGEMAHVIAVPEDAPYNSLGELLDAARSSPDSIVFAVGIGAPSHFAGLMLENAYSGAEFRFTQSGGGAKRFASLAGGHSEVTTFSVAEYVEFKESGIRALAILADERSEVIPEVKTAVEQGIEVVSANMHFWWVPKNTPKDRIERIAGALSAAMESTQVRQQLEDLATVPSFVAGSTLHDELKNREAKISQVSQRETKSVPNLTLALLALLAIAGLAVVVESNLKSVSLSGEQSKLPPIKWLTSIGLAAITVFYICILQMQLLNYLSATAFFICAAGATLSQRRSILLFVLVLAVGLSFTLNFLFTQILVIDLP